MADNYHQAYNELVQLEKSINAQLSELQKAVESGANIVKLESSIQANITAYASKRDMLERDHEKNHMKLPPKEDDKRTKTINNLKMNLDRMKMKFSGLTKKKYEYKVDEKYDNYQLDEQRRNMNNEELLQDQQRRLKDQDKDLEEIGGMVTKGNKMAKEIKTNLEDQNKLLDDVERRMDNLDSKMSTTKRKFDNYINKSSSCCLSVIIFIELLCFIGLLILVLQS